MARNPSKNKGVLHRELARAGLWVSSGQQLATPVRAPGLSSVTIASGALKVTPDIDIMAWLCAEWLENPTDNGLMNPTFLRIAQDLYGAQSGKAYALINDSLERMGRTTIEFEFYNEQYSADPFKSGGSIISYIKPRRTTSGEYQRATIDLHVGLRQGIATNAAVNLDWRVLRRFHGRQQLAKRLWCYLQAEHWKANRQSQIESTWMALGDRFYTALGLDFKEQRFAKRAVARACQAIKTVDLRYLADGAELDVQDRGGYPMLVASRPTAKRWATEEKELTARRAEIRAQLG